MKPKTKSLTWTVALAVVLSLVAARPCAAQLPATDLGVLPDRVLSHAIAMNSSGQIVGYCANLVWDNWEGDWIEDGTTDLPFVWQNGTMTPLPLLAGLTAGSAAAINSSGQIVGACWTTAGSPQACLWTRTGAGWTVTGLGVPAGCIGSWAWMINDAGQMVVQGGIEVWPWSVEYFRDSQGNMTLLQDLNGNLIFPLQMNSSAQIVGQVCSTWGGALWNAGAVTELVPWEYDLWINDLGQVAGVFGDNPNNTITTDFIYLPEAAYGLPAGLNKWPVGSTGDYFGGINNAGQVLVVTWPAEDGSGGYTTDLKVVQLGGAVSYQVTVPGWTTFQSGIAMNGRGAVAGTFSTADGGMKSFYAGPGTGLTLLGGLGGRYSRPAGLNDSGMIFGDSELADETVHACMWMAQYSWSGVLQPVNADGSSVFKAGSTVPVKFKLTGASTGITTLAATLSYALISSGVVGSINETVSISSATAGNLFRYDATAGQYIFNWSTKGLARGTYRLFINLGDGVERTVDLGLK